MDQLRVITNRYLDHHRDHHHQVAKRLEGCDVVVGEKLVLGSNGNVLKIACLVKRLAVRIINLITLYYLKLNLSI